MTLRYAVAVTGIIVAGCNAPTSRDGLSAVNETLRELQVPAVSTGAISHDSVWRVFVDASTSTSQLVLILKYPDLVLPDGEFELLAPLTYFRYEDGRWRQSTQSKGGTVIVASADSLLAKEFEDRARIYFYRVRTISLEAGAPSASTLDQIRLTVQDMLRQGAVLRRNGFIGADAEP